MDCKFLVVSSVTFAFKAKNILEEAGLSCKVEKIKDIATFGGCGYGVRIDAGYASAAVKALRRSNIKVIEVIDCEEGEIRT